MFLSARLQKPLNGPLSMKKKPEKKKKSTSAIDLAQQQRLVQFPPPKKAAADPHSARSNLHLHKMWTFLDTEDVEFV